MDRRVDIALASLFLVVVAPFVQLLTAQESSRYVLTAALTEQSRFEVDDYEPLMSVDRVELNGHVYSDKAPGQPVLGVPVLKVAQWLGAEPGTEFRHRANLGAWSQSLVFCAIPGSLLLVLMRRNAARSHAERWSLVAALSLAFGTLILPMSSALYAHVFVATLVFGAWHVLSGTSTPRVPVVLATGTMSAVAVASEYPMAGAAAVLSGYVFVRWGWRRALVFAIPHVISVGLIVAHSLRVYDRIGTGYSTKGDGISDSFGLPNPLHMVRIFFAEKGFAFTPIVIVGVVGLLLGLRERQRDLIVPGLMFGGFFLLQSGWVNPWGGETPGPRYVLAGIPFLASGVARMLPVIQPRIRAALIGFGILSMGLVIITMPLVLTGETLIIGHIRNIGRFGVTPTIFTMAFGSLGWVLHAALVVIAATALWRVWPSRDGHVSPADTDITLAG